MNKWIIGFARVLLIAVASIASAQAAPDSKDANRAKGTMPQTPTDTCKAMVQAAAADNYDKVVENTANYGGKEQVKRAEKKFEKMRGEYMAKLKGINCGAEHIAGSRAMVEAETQGEKRFIPFIKEGDAWKFDARTYTSFYPPKHGSAQSRDQTGSRQSS